MATVHVYVGIENLALSNAQRADLVSALQALGQRNASPQPAERNHWRIRNDNDAVIFEAVFDENNITIAAIKQFLATVFGIDASTIDHSTNATQYGRVATFTRNSTDYIRMISFSYDGTWSTREQSRLAAIQYLADNSAAWDSSE